LAAGFYAGLGSDRVAGLPGSVSPTARHRGPDAIIELLRGRNVAVVT
jgi:hypothetical protein